MSDWEEPLNADELAHLLVVMALSFLAGVLGGVGVGWILARWWYG